MHIPGLCNKPIFIIFRMQVGSDVDIGPIYKPSSSANNCHRIHICNEIFMQSGQFLKSCIKISQSTLSALRLICPKDVGLKSHLRDDAIYLSGYVFFGNHAQKSQISLYCNTIIQCQFIYTENSDPCGTFKIPPCTYCLLIWLKYFHVIP